MIPKYSATHKSKQLIINKNRNKYYEFPKQITWL